MTVCKLKARGKRRAELYTRHTSLLCLTTAALQNQDQMGLIASTQTLSSCGMERLSLHIFFSKDRYRLWVVRQDSGVAHYCEGNHECVQLFKRLCVKPGESYQDLKRPLCYNSSKDFVCQQQHLPLSHHQVFIRHGPQAPGTHLD